MLHKNHLLKLLAITLFALAACTTAPPPAGPPPRRPTPLRPRNRPRRSQPRVNRPAATNPLRPSWSLTTTRLSGPDAPGDEPCWPAVVDQVPASFSEAPMLAEMVAAGDSTTG